MIHIPAMIKVRLKELLQERGKSLYRLAAETGVTYNTLHAVANGKRDSIHYPTLDKICKSLACEPGDILIHVSPKAKRAPAAKA